MDRLPFPITPAVAPTADIPDPLPVDPWVASSLLQKAIRRGETTTALSAAITLHRQRGGGVWRRLMVIAFEDVGVGSTTALVQTVNASTSSDARRHLGGDVPALLHLTRILAEAPTDRSADYLICSAKDHPELEAARERSGCSSITERLGLVEDCNLPISARATAAWYASGIEWGEEKRFDSSDLPSLLHVYRSCGVPKDLVDATSVAAARTREPITIMVPLTWLVAHRSRPPIIVHTPVPVSPLVGGVPLYAFDKHTHIGKRAVHLFARENDAVRECLEHHVPDFRARAAACVAAFYADGAPVLRRLSWDGSASLELLGTENNLMREGVSKAGVIPLLEVDKSSLNHLNAIRTRLLQTGT